MPDPLRRGAFVLAILAGTAQLGACQIDATEAEPDAPGTQSVQTDDPVGQPPQPETEQRVTDTGMEPRAKSAEFGSDFVTYRFDVMAPDACFVADAEQTVTTDGTKVSVRRILKREPGMCAQVLTRVEFSGRVDGLATAPDTLELAIVSPQGEVLDNGTFNRSD